MQSSGTLDTESCLGGDHRLDKDYVTNGLRTMNVQNEATVFAKSRKGSDRQKAVIVAIGYNY
jgi:hypothetical protein